jgi:hypothetical protein
MLYVLTSVDYVGVIDLRDAVLGVPADIIAYAVMAGLPASFLLAFAAASLANELCQLGRLGWGWIIGNGVLLLLLEVAPVVETTVWDFAPWLPWLVWLLVSSAFGMVVFVAGRR